jgi:hypothetical protein
MIPGGSWRDIRDGPEGICDLMMTGTSALCFTFFFFLHQERVEAFE